MNNTFLLFYSPKPRSQVCILIYRNWSIASYDEELRVFTESELFCFFVFQMLSKRHSFMQYLINLADQGIVHDVPDLRDRVQQLLNLIPSGKSLSSLPLFTVSGFYTLEKQT